MCKCVNEENEIGRRKPVFDGGKTRKKLAARLGIAIPNEPGIGINWN
jgi:hypothetical protein